MKDKGEEYKKSYSGFIIWMVLFIAAMSVLPLFPIIQEKEKIGILIIGNLVTISMAILTLIIYVNDKIYWYNGISYEEAKECGAKLRKKCAFRHFKRFGIFAMIYLIYSMISVIADFPYAADVYYLFIGIVITAISTIGIKLKKDK